VTQKTGQQERQFLQGLKERIDGPGEETWCVSQQELSPTPKRTRGSNLDVLPVLDKSNELLISHFPAFPLRIPSVGSASLMQQKLRDVG
jgi:hypothetical protein